MVLPILMELSDTVLELWVLLLELARSGIRPGDEAVAQVNLHKTLEESRVLLEYPLISSLSLMCQ